MKVDNLANQKSLYMGWSSDSTRDREESKLDINILDLTEMQYNLDPMTRDYLAKADTNTLSLHAEKNVRNLYSCYLLQKILVSNTSKREYTDS